MMYIPAIVAVAQHFTDGRRSLALGKQIMYNVSQCHCTVRFDIKLEPKGWSMAVAEGVTERA